MGQTYADYLASPQWHAKRQSYLRERTDCCQGQVAGARCCAKPVDIHHWTYRRVRVERLDDLVAVCRSCHERIHQLALGGGAKALRQATQTVCGDGPWNGFSPCSDSKQRKRELKAARREAGLKRKVTTRSGREIAPIQVKCRKVKGDGPLPRAWSPAPPFKPRQQKRTEPATLDDHLRAFGAALRSGDSRRIGKRLRKLRNVAKAEGREDIRAALRNYHVPSSQPNKRPRRAKVA